jgi:hypothetical protein
MKPNRHLVAALCIALGACALPAQRELVTLPPFDSAAHARFLGNGTLSITGQAFLRQRGGAVVTCAGAPVYLMPATDYYEAVVWKYSHRDGGAGSFSPTDALTWVRVGRCDASGSFSFTGLPAADWIVITEVIWSVGYYSQGGTLSKRVSSTAQTTAVILGSDDRLLR